MIDREKVMKGLEQHCERSMFDRCGECPYYDVNHENGFICRDELLSDALKMLKEQEAKIGKWVEQGGYDGDVYYDCSVCGESWVTIEGIPQENRMLYCPHCGAKMEGR